MHIWWRIEKLKNSLHELHEERDKLLSSDALSQAKHMAVPRSSGYGNHNMTMINKATLPWTSFVNTEMSGTAMKQPEAAQLLDY